MACWWWAMAAWCASSTPGGGAAGGRAARGRNLANMPRPWSANSGAGPSTAIRPTVCVPTAAARCCWRASCPPARPTRPWFILEDFDRIHRQIQQVKLAALGGSRPASPTRSATRWPPSIRRPSCCSTKSGRNAGPPDPHHRQQRPAHRPACGRRAGPRRRDEALPEALPLAEFRREFIDEFALTEDWGARGVVVNRCRRGSRWPWTAPILRQILWNLVGNARRHCSGGPAAVKSMLHCAMTDA